MKVKPIRDDAMEFLIDGNFFKAESQSIKLDTYYALILSKRNPLNTQPLLKLDAAQNSPKNTYSSKCMTLHAWGDESQQLLEGSSQNTEVYKIRFMKANA